MNSCFRYLYSIITAILILVNSASSMPPLNGGPMPDRPAGVDEPDIFAPARDDAQLEGEWNLLILMVDFPDYPWDNQDDENFDNEGNIYDREHIESMLFSEGNYAHPGAENDFTGSMRDFYAENSHGNFTVTGTVTEWLRAPENYTFYCNTDGEFGTRDDYGYGDYEHSVRQLVEDALELADESIDYSDFDNNGDGLVDGLFIVHAGPGAEIFGRTPLGANYFWSHKWNIIAQRRDGVIISGYTMQPEDGTIGVFCHEFGHALGLPDLYDTDFSSNGMGNWELMAGGSWTHRAGDPRGTSPVHMSAWCKSQLGWVEVINITETVEDVEIAPVEESGIVYRLWTNGGINDSLEYTQEYFMIENRRRIGFDRGLTRRQIEFDLPAPEGLLITHIDEARRGNNRGNTDENHRLVDVEEASPVWIEGEPLENLDRAGNNRDLFLANSGDEGDLWPGFSTMNDERSEWTGDRDRDAFSVFTTPSSNGYDGTPSLVNVYDIRTDGDIVIASFSVTAPEFPLLYIADWAIDDGEEGNGAIEPGETIELSVTLANIGEQGATAVSAAMSYAGDLAQVARGQSNYPDIPSNQSRAGQQSFIIEIDEDAPGRATLALDFIISTEEMDDYEYTLRLGINPASDWFKVENNPVLTSNIGAWDTAILSPSVIVADDTLRCWYIGTAEAPEDGGPILGSVGYAFSPDGGLNWTKLGGQVMTAEDVEWVEGGISGIDVEMLDNGSILMMFTAPDADGTVKVGQAISEDGFDWEADAQPVFEADGFAISEILPVQLSIEPYFDDGYVCGFSAITPVGSVILFGITADFDNWTIDQGLILPPSDDDGRCDALTVFAPEVKLISGEEFLYHIYYTGTTDDDIGRLARADFDGNALSYYAGLGTLESVLEGDVDDWAGVTDILGCRIFSWEGEDRMLYTGVGDESTPAVGLAVSNLSALDVPLLPDTRASIPEIIILDPAYPNPFNNRVSLNYHLKYRSAISLIVVDVRGRIVRNLYSGSQPAGSHRISWNGLNNDNYSVGSGTYFLMYKSGDVTMGKKLLLIK